MSRRLDDAREWCRRELSMLRSRLSTLCATLAARLRSTPDYLKEGFPVLERRRRTLLAAVLVPLGLMLAFAIGLGIDVVKRLPDPRALSSIGEMPESTLVYDAFDEPAFTIFSEQRVTVPIERLSPHLLDAVLAVEDRRFYEHGGIDLVRVAGAAVANMSAGRIVEGGSTITQQLARKSLLSSERTFRRKLAEILTALWIEHVYDKREIFELYLNAIYFGSGFYGVETASRGYLGKPAAELSVSDASLLAGLIQAPERYSPTRFPDRAIARRNVVLRVLLETKVIDEQAFDDARREPLSLHNSLETTESYGHYFQEELRQQLVDRFGWDAVYERGLRVYATIDPAMQRGAEEALELGIREIEDRSGYTQPRRVSDESPDSDSDSGSGSGSVSGSDGDPRYLQGALIALDPVTGEVRALVGGRDFADSRFNRATQAHRQPGSAFKPILYAAAVEGGVAPTTILDELDRPVTSKEGAWLPADGHDEESALTVRASLQMSSNRAAVRLLSLTGIDRTVDYAARFGLGPQPRVPSLALGSGSVTLEALTGAYAAFANGGTVPRPTYIRRVMDGEGTVLFDAASSTPEPSRAIEPSTAFVVANLLRGVLDAGTGWTVRREGFRAPAAGKTGTTDDVKDAWFIGFTPELAAGVWIGFDEPRTIVPRGYGSDLAAPVWAKFMSEAVGTRQKSKWIEPPPGVVRVEVCAASLAVASDACRRRRADVGDSEGSRPASTYMEYFVSGTEPVDRCPVHQSFLTTVLAPFRGESGKEGEGRAVPPREVMNALQSGQPVVPVVHDHIFGNCAGHLVAGTDGLHYVTRHKDAFTIGSDELGRASVDIDVDMQHVHVSVHDGRDYNFYAESADRDALLALEAALRPR